MEFYDEIYLILEDIELTVKSTDEVSTDTIYRILEVLKLLVSTIEE
jgi:hypothetical protein